MKYLQLISIISVTILGVYGNPYFVPQQQRNVFPVKISLVAQVQPKPLIRMEMLSIPFYENISLPRLVILDCQNLTETSVIYPGQIIVNIPSEILRARQPLASMILQLMQRPRYLIEIIGYYNKFLYAYPYEIQAYAREFSLCGPKNNQAIPANDAYVDGQKSSNDEEVMQMIQNRKLHNMVERSKLELMRQFENDIGPLKESLEELKKRFNNIYIESKQPEKRKLAEINDERDFDDREEEDHEILFPSAPTSISLTNNKNHIQKEESFKDWLFSQTTTISLALATIICSMLILLSLLSLTLLCFRFRSVAKIP